jgi:hypothetical protein
MRIDWAWRIRRELLAQTSGGELSAARNIAAARGQQRELTRTAVRFRSRHLAATEDREDFCDSSNPWYRGKWHFALALAVSLLAPPTAGEVCLSTNVNMFIKAAASERHTNSRCEPCINRIILDHHNYPADAVQETEN